MKWELFHVVSTFSCLGWNWRVNWMCVCKLLNAISFLHKQLKSSTEYVLMTSANTEWEVWMCVKCMFASCSFIVFTFSSHVSFMDKRNICLFYSLSVSPCLPPPLPLLFWFPPSIFIAPCHPNSIHSSLSDQREGAFYSLSLLLLRGSADGSRVRLLLLRAGLSGPPCAAAG